MIWFSEMENICEGFLQLLALKAVKCSEWVYIPRLERFSQILDFFLLVRSSSEPECESPSCRELRGESVLLLIDRWREKCDKELALAFGECDGARELLLACGDCDGTKELVLAIGE